MESVVVRPRRFAMIIGSYLLIWAWRFFNFAYRTEPDRHPDSGANHRGVAQSVEHWFPKPAVAGSSPSAPAI